MTEPVRYVELVRRLADEGTSVFIEVGPGNVLTRLTQRILAGRDVVVLASDDRKTGGLDMLLGIQERLESVNRSGDEQSPGQPPQQLLKTPAEPKVVRDRRATASNVMRIEEVPPKQSVPSLRLLTLAGSPYEMGLTHGTRCASQIRTIMRRYADAADMADGVLQERRFSSSDLEVYFGPEELEELEGIAEGAQVSLLALAGHNLRIYPDGAGCIHFAVTARHNDGPARAAVGTRRPGPPAATGFCPCDIQHRGPAGRRHGDQQPGRGRLQRHAARPDLARHRGPRKAARRHRQASP
jgi:hypothetical protein